MATVGEELVRNLAARGVEAVFGIPGVHTIELYRGLPASGIRHVTPRHEQGAGFMADGYARRTGRPGVALVITGPGLTNILTPMGQARAEGVPMLVLSSTLARRDLGRWRGTLHELPDQRATVASVAVDSQTLLDPAGLGEAIERAWAMALGAGGRAGPAHLEVPLDVLALPAPELAAPRSPLPPPAPDAATLDEAARRLEAAERPAILAGGGARRAEAALRALAEALDAPVVQTTNARGLMAGHPLAVAASPSLGPVRALLAEADAVLAVGCEFGATDLDMYEDGGFPPLRGLIRVDRDAARIARGPEALALVADAGVALAALGAALGPRRREGTGAERAARAGDGARAALEPAHARALTVLETIRDTLPQSPIFGDSTEPVYAGNLVFAAGGPGLWCNSATGFGTLGWALPAAAGAAVADPSRPVVALAGDGGLQFTLAELGVLADERLPVIVVVWNNHGYREIETAMRGAGAEPVGVTPGAPDFVAVAAAYGLRAERVEDPAALPGRLRAAAEAGGPALLEIPAAAIHGSRG
ncbi:5-guanidino-2-oxopentanoate decarboxylase [Rubellimicrobium sp. CFH 75288]|uniref:5-guanidino-2-oxopentanoate decarboxylase n=1 Tax=Rubellimicrobium sp. CFH 75288 TaxID=2697034 RepID=UPI001412D032|nr:5-guanidino-2-oxopentanoate decarboxylase [Rubellimicrobium sp. CFH 75288]